jgi:trans-2,3-dihydro-3-hydroxyanthranilate isomerase
VGEARPILHGCAATMARMRIPFIIADVFTERPMAGNQLCVVPDSSGMSAELMQAVAHEINFSESTFVSEASGDRYAMRIFTPGGELPFAGHPSLGTMFVLASQGKVSSPATQVVQAGEFAIEADPSIGFARMRQHAPDFAEPFDDRELLARAAGIDVGDLHPTLVAQPVSTGIHHLMVPAASREVVAHAQQSPVAVKEALEKAGGDAFYLFAVDDKGAKARLFDVQYGIGEDPATGSAAGPLGAYVVHHGAHGPGRIEIEQGVEIGRPSTLIVDVEPDGDTLSIHVGGGVAIVGEGVFDVPA